jgi:type II secretory pathway pseudopilin PulG
MARAEEKRRGGYSLTELGITIGIVGVAMMIALPSLNRANENSELRDTAITLDSGLANARAEAMRTGDVHLFFIMQDAEGNALVDPAGNAVPVLIVNDGAPGSADQNCRIDPGERTISLSSEELKKIAMMSAPPTGVEIPAGDHGSGNPGQNGSSFVDPAGNSVTWVMFRPEGMPMAFDVDCNLGEPGSGAGSLYMHNEDRSYVVTLSPMGTTRVMTFNETSGAWE